MNHTIPKPVLSCQHGAKTYGLETTQSIRDSARLTTDGGKHSGMSKSSKVLFILVKARPVKPGKLATACRSTDINAINRAWAHVMNK